MRFSVAVIDSILENNASELKAFQKSGIQRIKPIEEILYGFLQLRLGNRRSVGIAFKRARLIRADMDLKSVAVEFDGPSHVAPGFGQLYPLDGKDGYVYLFGRFGGRQKGIKVARVKREDFERFSAYEYLVRYENGEPVWLPYREGIDAIIADPTAADVIPAPTSNMAVHWNEYLGKWVLTYYRTKTGICYATADHPYGPYSKPVLLISIKLPALTADLPSKSGASGLYGGFTHEMMNREYGKIMPVVISQWYVTSAGPRFYGSKMFEIEFE